MLGTSLQKLPAISAGPFSPASGASSIINLFELQAAKNAHAIAIIWKEQNITYQQLNDRANQLAFYLRKKGIKEEIMVPVCIERGPDMVVALLGVLKAGAAYVPIDPTYPAGRIAYMLHDSRASFVISSKQSHAAIVQTAGIEVLEIESDCLNQNTLPVTNPQVSPQPGHLAYVIYTSGSTGKPKGVMIEHGNVSLFIRWCMEEFAPDSFNLVYAVTSICFDLSVFELFFPLCIGKPVRILTNGLEIGAWLPYDKAVLLNTVPVVIDNLLKQGTNLANVTVINMAGEPVPLHVQQGLDTNKIQVRNLYGPTEDTTYSTIYRMHKDGPILIGKPISNTIVRIVGENGELVAAGTAGEICIGGGGLARGYLNREELTKERFINDPFLAAGSTKLYKTGDLGRLLPDNNLEYLGRLDDQVKIRGYRIELGEIESMLQQSGFVQQAVVVAKGIGDQKRLVAYFLPNNGEVKKKEQQLYLERVNSWKEIYEVEYVKTGQENTNEEFNLIARNDSFTGAPIAGSEMRIWLDDIVQVILSEQPVNVLEIGCGTGLIYYQLAGKVEKYIGTDFSRSSVSQIQQRINKGLRDYGETELHVCAAHEVTVSAGQEVDTVVLNSIVQYFPGEVYLDSVLEKSLELLKGKGRIIIGDVRDQRLLQLFNSRIYLQNAPADKIVREFKWTVDTAVLQENELCLAPEYFYNLQARFPQITHVEIRWKNNHAANEMALYRYTVVLYVGIDKQIIEPVAQKWTAFTVQNVAEQTGQGTPVIVIENAPNPRLYKERALNEALNNDDALVVTLQESLSINDEESKSVWRLLSTASEAGYNFKLLVNSDPLRVNILLERQPAGHFTKPVYSKNDIHQNKLLYTNIPLFSEIVSLMQKDMVAALQKELPAFMIPAEFIALGNFPLTQNGKVDRRFLAEVELIGSENRSGYAPPVTTYEKDLVGIWQNLLGIDQIGINDNFFHLGGHSLLAIRIIAAIRSRSNVEVSLKDLVMYPTIAALAGQLHALEVETATGPVKSKLLIPLKTNGHKTPLYIISGGGGTVFAFKRFVHLLDDDQPVFGLQQPTEKNDIDEFPETIQGIASRYINEILVQNPDGPYALSGHCVGGIIAFEMARQLQVSGKVVCLLAMFDTILPKPYDPTPGTFSNFYHIPYNFNHLLSKIYRKLDFEVYLLRNHTKHAFQYKLNALKSLLNTVDPYKDEDLEMKVYKTLEGNFEKANANYVLTPLKRHILVFYAKDHYYFVDRKRAIDYKKLQMDDDTRNRWTDYAGSVTIHEVDGEHSTVFDPVHGNNFARLLQQALNNMK